MSNEENHHLEKESSSESILSDETCTDCAVCSEPLDDNGVTCGKCGSTCYPYCMCQPLMDICSVCVATDEQLNFVGGRVVRWPWVNFQCRGVLQFGL